MKMVSSARKSSTADQNPLKVGLRSALQTARTVLLFSLCTNVLLLLPRFTCCRSTTGCSAAAASGTLISITVIAGMLLAVYGLLEMVRTRVLVRAGILFDENRRDDVQRDPPWHAPQARRETLGQALRDVDTLREFLTGSGLLAFCDAPWFPVFVLLAFWLHPWYGWIAIIGSLVIWSLTLLNEMLTKRDLTEATNASIAASQRAATTFRNVEVLQAMGMLGALRRLGLASPPASYRLAGTRQRPRRHADCRHEVLPHVLCRSSSWAPAATWPSNREIRRAGSSPVRSLSAGPCSRWNWRSAVGKASWRHVVPIGG